MMLGRSNPAEFSMNWNSGRVSWSLSTDEMSPQEHIVLSKFCQQIYQYQVRHHAFAMRSMRGYGFNLPGLSVGLLILHSPHAPESIVWPRLKDSAGATVYPRRVAGPVAFMVTHCVTWRHDQQTTEQKSVKCSGTLNEHRQTQTFLLLVPHWCG